MNKEITSDSSAIDRPDAKEVPLRFVLNQTEEIKENVKEAANQIGSVNAVLKQKEKIPSLVPSIETIIMQNQEAEQKVTKAVVDLQEVSADLAREVAERIDIESELIQTKNELFELRADLSKSQAKEEDALQIALHDVLTGLPNRLLFEQRLEHGVTQAARYGWQLAVMFIDLDKFKSINDSYGHDMGDKVLLEVAKRLQAFVRGEDMVSRWGGDEFVCILLNVNFEADVISLAQKMVDQIAEDCEFNGTILSISATIGIAIYPKHGETPNILLKEADRAMYKSRVMGKRVMLFSESHFA